MEKPRLSIGQILTNEIQHNGPFADAVGDAPHGSIANIADSEDTGDVGFQQERIALQLPARWPLAIRG
jgi:hypothetical protein